MDWRAAMTPVLAKSYLGEFQGSHTAAADYAGVAIPVIKRALHGEYLNAELVLRLYSAARKRMGAAKVETILGIPTPAPLPLGTSAMVNALVVSVPEPEAAVQAATPMLRCKRCGEEKPADLEHFLPIAGRKRIMRPRALCRLCFRAAAHPAAAAGTQRYWAAKRAGGAPVEHGQEQEQEGDNMADVAVSGQLPVSQQLLALAAAVERLEQRDGQAEGSAKLVAELQAENARLRGELAHLEAFRSNLAALLGPRA